MRCRLMALILLAALAAACDDSSTPARITGPGSGTLQLAGTWTGSGADSTRQMSMTWRLTQSDGNVTGTFSATTPVGAPIYTAGAVSGTLSGATLTFTITVPGGAVEGNPDCTATFTGTADDVREDSMAGTYQGSDSCGGTFTGGRFTLLRQ